MFPVDFPMTGSGGGVETCVFGESKSCEETKDCEFCEISWLLETELGSEGMEIGSEAGTDNAK